MAKVDGLMSERILNAALALFKARGYHGASVRELADAVAIEPASLYYHFASKQDILFALFERIMNPLPDGLGAAMAGGTTYEDKLRSAVRFHVLFHIARQDEAFLSHSELRSLSAPNRRRVIAQRDRYERMIRTLLAAGVRAGEFEIPDVKLTSTAILVMCSGVSDWFVGRGRLTADMVADYYADMAVRLVARPENKQARPSGVRKPSRISRRA